MDEKQASETIQSFTDMVNAVDKISKPLKIIAITSAIVTVITNIIWAVVISLHIYYSYRNPDTSFQVQDYDDKHMSQSVGTEVVTQGD